MCDYSLESVASRPAMVGDKLVSSRFSGSITRGFAAQGEPDVAVCLLPGTELAFDREIECEGSYGYFTPRMMNETVGRFRHINEDQPNMHHDALELPDGRIVLLTHLCLGQHATVLQLPAAPTAETEKETKAHAPIAS